MIFFSLNRVLDSSTAHQKRLSLLRVPQCAMGGHGWWHLGHHDQKHSANGGVLTKSLDLKVAHKRYRQTGL